MVEPTGELRILLLEDVPSDAELEEMELRDAGLAYTLLRVDTRAAFLLALDEFKPDIVLADFKLPDYNGREALEYVRRTHPQIPVIIVTGVMGDEAAVELLKQGARDYVLKDHLPRLVPAIQRALSEERGIRNRKLAEKNLRESEEKFRRLSDSAQDAIFMMDADGKISFWNKAAQKIFGYTAEESLGREMLGLLAPPSTYSAYKKLMERFIASGENPVLGKALELVALRKDGIEFPVELSVSGVQLGEKWHSIGIVRDITERKHAEDLLRQERDFSNSLVETAQVIILVLSPQGRIVRFNHFMETLTGYSLKDVEGKDWFSTFLPESDREETMMLFQGAIHNIQTHGNVNAILTKDGRQLLIEWYDKTLKDEEGNTTGLLAIGLNVTERKRAEKKLLRINRTLRTLSAGNEMLVKAVDEAKLLDDVCRIIVDVGEHRMAWVGYAGHDDAKSIIPMACTGVEKSDLAALQLTWADAARGQSSLARAIRSGQLQISRDILKDSNFEFYQKLASAHDWNANLAVPLADGQHIFGALSIFSADPDAFDTEEVALLNELGHDLAYGINALRTRTERDRAMEESSRNLEKIRQNLEDAIQAIAATVEMRDPTTAGHEKHVAELSVAIGRELGLTKDRLDGLRIAASVFDVGKVRIPAEILNRPGTLDKLTFSMIKLHPETGYEILKGIDFPWPVATIVRQHHERLDGSGYPKGLKGSEILLEAQILGVADVVESMMSHRPYRPSLGMDAALKELMDNRGKLYNADVVDACIKLFKEKGFSFS